LLVAPIIAAPATAKPLVGATVLTEYPIAALPFTCNLEPKVVVPIPVLPAASKYNIVSYVVPVCV